MDENEERQAMVEEAMSWCGTPYVLGAAVKGAGTDCGRLLAECLIARGLAEREDLGVYSHDWFCHDSGDRYMMRLLRHAAKTMEGICRGTIDAKPGCMILFKTATSKVYNHGAIITHWPFVIHATADGVKESNATRHYLMAHMQMCIFDPWSKSL